MEDSMIGKVFGRWTVIDFASPNILKGNKKRRRWKCRCECGVERVVEEPSLIRGYQGRADVIIKK